MLKTSLFLLVFFLFLYFPNTLIKFSYSEKLLPLTLSYKFDRYQTTKKDCKDSANTSYHNVAVIDFQLPKNMNWGKIKFMKLVDHKNNLAIKYTVDHHKSRKGMLYYHTPLFGKKTHYEYSLDEEEGGESYLYYYYNYYSKVIHKKSALQILGIGFNELEIFKTKKIAIDYKTIYKKEWFPVFNVTRLKGSSDSLQIRVNSKKRERNGYVQYKFKGKLTRNFFKVPAHKKTLIVKHGKYDSYLAIMINNDLGYENKMVLFRTCKEYY